MIDPMHQFMVHVLIPLSFFGFDVSLTNSALFMLLTTSLLMALFYFGVNPKALIPGRTQVVLESLYGFITDTLFSSVGENAKAYLPYVFSLFLFISAGNLLGMVPYSFTITSQIIVTLTLSMIVFVTVTILGFVKHGTHYFRLFLPEGIPLYLAPLLVLVEVLSYLARPITLATRLFVNMVAGHAIMKIFAALTMILVGSLWFPLAVLPLTLNVIITAFEIFICLLQAYVFTILSCIYLNDALNMH
jgi:F-type H+-transporting ATPase subunit a